MDLWSKFIILTGLVWATLTHTALAQYETPAPHALIMDHETGIVLFEKNATMPMAPASMTKIMTVEMVLDAIKSGRITLDTTFPVSEEAWRRGGVQSGSSTMFLDLNSEVRVEDLLRGAIIQSGNDACIALAEGLAGNEVAFAQQMTRRAKVLGLETANFKNSTGWPHPEHKISALDLAKLSRHLIKTHPDFYPIYAEREFEWNNVKQGNRNPLLGRMTGADGIKTGSTEASGYGLVGSAKLGDDRRIIVINGLASKKARQSESLKIMTAAFAQFDVYDIYEAGKIIGQADVYMGQDKTVGLKLGETVKLGLHMSQRDSVNAKIEYKSPTAPITAGQNIGELIVTAAGKDEQRYPLYAAEDIKAKSIFGKAWAVLLKKIRG